jgi:hypothetical protein
MLVTTASIRWVFVEKHLGSLHAIDFCLEESKETGDDKSKKKSRNQAAFQVGRRVSLSKKE